MMTIKTSSINKALLALLTKVEQDSPYLLSQFECMYYLGCRAMESIEKERWTILDNQFVLLEASKRNNQRIFMLEDVPISFLSYINNDYILESHVSWTRYHRCPFLAPRTYKARPQDQNCQYADFRQNKTCKQCLKS